MGRQPCCDKVGLKRGPWTIEEDRKLMTFILNNGIQCWRMVPKLAGLLRCGKSCRLRWINYLRPDLKRGALSEAEEDQIIELHRRLGNRWSKIASHFPGRTDNEIKNHWNTRIKKRLRLLGLDPLTHQPIQRKEVIESDNQQVEGGNGDDRTSCYPQNNQENGNICMMNGYETMWRSVDADMWTMNQETNNHYSTCYSPSFSACESSISVPEDIGSKNNNNNNNNGYLQQWFMSTVDSVLSWDGFDQVNHHHLQQQQQQLFLAGSSSGH